MPVPKNEKTDFYLFGSFSKQAENVFFKVKGERLAKLLCGLFTREYANPNGYPTFHWKTSSSFSPEERVLLDEALDGLAIYDDPDPGVYDPSPSRETHLLAQYAVRASKWEDLFKQQIEAFETSGTQNANDAKKSEAEQLGNQPHMPPEEWQNAGLILLMMLAQTYYTILEKTISVASWFTTLDLELNQSYFWTLENITNLLKNHEGLKDFPVKFEPPFPDLYPSTIADLDWQDMVAPDAEQFLSAVQRYVHAKGIHQPKEGSAAWIFVELFRPSIDNAIQKANEYYTRIDTHRRKLFRSPPKDNSNKVQNNAGSETKTGEKRFKIALSFPGERRAFIEQVAAHLAGKVGHDKILYDKYHEPELARVDLDTYLQKLYHDESEMVAVFLCSDYERKEWCGLEWRSLRDLIKKRQCSAIMPLRFDNTEISGLLSIDGYVEIGSRSSLEIANSILERMRINAAA